MGIKMTNTSPRKRSFSTLWIIVCLILFFSAILFKIHEHYENKISSLQKFSDHAAYTIVLLSFPGYDTDKGFVSSVPDMRAEDVLRGFLQFGDSGYQIKTKDGLLHVISNDGNRFVIAVNPKNNQPIIKKGL